MATLRELFNLRHDSDMRNRTAAASWRWAKAIFHEADNTPNHAARIAWAISCLRNGQGECIEEIFRGVSILLEDTNSTSTDEEVEAAVNTVLSKLASVEV